HTTYHACTATPDSYTLSLHDALPIFAHKLPEGARWPDLAGRSGLNLLDHYRQMLLDLGKSEDPLIAAIYADAQTRLKEPRHLERSEEHTSELQSRENLVCRLLLEKKK